MVSPIGVAEGKYSKKKRLILDLSSPHNNSEHFSINDYIIKEEFSLQYLKIDDAIRIIQHLGEGALLTKVDVQDAFRILPVNPQQWPLLSIKWGGLYYMYVRLPFGSRSSPKIFTELSKAIQWIATTNYKIKNLLYLLDDFLAIDPPNYPAINTRVTLLNLFASLGVPLNQNKTVGPSTCLEYLGITLDSLKQEARLPAEKVARISDILREVSKQSYCSKRELLCVLGHLNFATRVIIPGRTFMANLIQLSTTVKLLHQKIRLTTECQQDIAMWLELLSKFNGVSMFHDSNLTSNIDLEVYTDSSSSVGFGGFNKKTGEYFADTWDNHPLPVGSHSMSYMELYPIVVASLLWGREWERKNIAFMCDNEGTVAILQKGRSKCCNINKLMRSMVLCATNCNFIFTAQWISTKVNVEADALSRGLFHVFQATAPKAQRIPCPLPAQIAFNSPRQLGKDHRP